MTVHQFGTLPIPQLVLIVDADTDMRELYKAFLVPRRYVVLTAPDGADALRQASREVPDIVITETRLPEMNGYILCRRSRADRRTEAVPIVVLTAETRTLQLERARQVGADAVLIKPCLPEILLREMEQLRDRSRALRARADEVRRLARTQRIKSAELVARSTDVAQRSDQTYRRTFGHAAPVNPESD